MTEHPERKLTIEMKVECLLYQAINNGLIEKSDIIQMRNQILDLLGLTEPATFAPEAGANLGAFVYYADNETNSMISPGAYIIAEICEYALQKRITNDAEAFSARLMGILTPRQSYVEAQFTTRYASDPKEATDWFYKFSQATDYIRTLQIAKNQYWRTPTEYGDLEITVNLSKPEKDPRQIAAAKSARQTGYPSCLLCAENVGFAGNLNHPARQNHRIIPVSMSWETWFFQYSPYVYYNEHCIVLNAKHVPMKLSRNTFSKLLSFLDTFPHYFIGSNADLPIVGGSILSHDHFQGGRHVFPMEIAEIERPLRHYMYPELSAGILKWPMSVLRISGADSEQVAKLAGNVYEHWQKYTDECAGVRSFSTNGKGTYEYHNTVTPIARMRDGLYEMDIVLRNNRTNEEHPLGIFHPHADVHHIKKENIGLIEVMGLAILPGRLESELRQIARIIAGEEAFSGQDGLDKHAHWIGELSAKYSNPRPSFNEAEELLKHEVGLKFERVLTDCAVFKRDEVGEGQFIHFLVGCGFEKKT